MTDDIETAEALAATTKRLKERLGTIIIGQDEVIDRLLISLFANKHCFMVGLPGLAKTLIVSTLARTLELSFKRIQFTPDLMPSDITGTELIQEDPETGKRHFEFSKGPIFANMILADEINRTPPKTQAALLEAMQERQVTAGNITRKLPPPFFVLATQNPIEQEGTYPLPEAQLDRFMMQIMVRYPHPEDELRILKMTTVQDSHDIQPVLTADEVIELQGIVRRVPVGDHVFNYALELTRKTRPADDLAPKFVRDWVEIGSGPRAGQNLILGAKARAVMNGRFYATCADVKAVAVPVMRHRIVTNFNADSTGITPDDIIERILRETPYREEVDT
jgi:MoxR-like ATPase